MNHLYLHYKIIEFDWSAQFAISARCEDFALIFELLCRLIFINPCAKFHISSTFQFNQLAQTKNIEF